MISDDDYDQVCERNDIPYTHSDSVDFDFSIDTDDDQYRTPPAWYKRNRVSTNTFVGSYKRKNTLSYHNNTHITTDANCNNLPDITNNHRSVISIVENATGNSSSGTNYYNNVSNFNDH